MYDIHIDRSEQLNRRKQTAGDFCNWSPYYEYSLWDKYSLYSTQQHEYTRLHRIESAQFLCIACISIGLSSSIGGNRQPATTASAITSMSNSCGTSALCIVHSKISMRSTISCWLLFPYAWRRNRWVWAAQSEEPLDWRLLQLVSLLRVFPMG